MVGDAGGLGSPPGDESTVVSSGQPPDHLRGSWEREGKSALLWKGILYLGGARVPSVLGLYEKVEILQIWLWRWY